MSLPLVDLDVVSATGDNTLLLAHFMQTGTVLPRKGRGTALAEKGNHTTQSRAEQQTRRLKLKPVAHPRTPTMSAMDVVALQGFLDDKSLLQLSTAGSRTVTRPARHHAMKRQMQLKMNQKGAREEFIISELNRSVEAFSFMVTCNNPRLNQEIALSRITTMRGRPVINLEVWRWANAYRDFLGVEPWPEPEEMAPDDPPYVDPTGGEIFQL